MGLLEWLDRLVRRKSMNFEWIKDLRVRYREIGEVDVYIATLSGGDSRRIPAARIGAMLQVFNLGYRCYWDSTRKVFSTDLTLPESPQPQGQTREGDVSSWDIVIPMDGEVLLVLNLLPDLPGAAPVKHTSGEAVTGKVIVRISTEEELAGVVAMLSSDYLRYEGGSLRNSDYQDWM